MTKRNLFKRSYMRERRLSGTRTGWVLAAGMAAVWVWPVCVPAASHRPAVTRVSSIDRQVNGVDRELRKYARAEKTLLTGTDRGGALTAYLDHGQPRKVVVEIGVSNRDYVGAYYYAGRGLSMVVWTERDFKWDAKKEELDYTLYKSVTTRRYYFQDGHMTAWRADHGGVIHRKRDAEFQEKERTLTEDANKYWELAMSKEKEVDIEKWVKEGK
jgi:hypothetical protein